MRLSLQLNNLHSGIIQQQLKGMKKFMNAAIETEYLGMGTSGWCIFYRRFHLY